MKERDLCTLLDYYRIKVDSFEKERFSWLNKLEELNLNLNDKHTLQWENKIKTAEILSLQKIKNDLLKVIHEERQNNHKLTAEIAYLKERSKKDRNRIIELLKLSDPIEQEIVLDNKNKPIIKQSMSIIPDENKSKINISQKRGRSVSSLARIRPDGNPIVKTIVFPNEKRTNNDEEINFLKSQIIDNTHFFEDIIKRQLDEFKMEKEELINNTEKLNKELERILLLNKKAEEMNINLTKDIIIIKADYSLNERKVNEELELCKLENQSLIYAIKDFTEKSTKEKEIRIRENENKTKTITAIMKSQLKSNDENIKIIKEQYKHIQAIYKEKIILLEDSIFKLMSENQKLKECYLETEGREERKNNERIGSQNSNNIVNINQSVKKLLPNESSKSFKATKLKK